MSNIVDLDLAKFISVDGSNEPVGVQQIFGLSNERILNFSTHLENAGSKEMNVDGSVTHVDFIVGPPAGERWFIYDLSVFLEDPGQTKHDSFGAEPALADPGLEWFFNINSTETRFLRVLDNAEIINEFSSDPVIPGQNIFLESGDVFRGSVKFLAPTMLDGDNGDQVIARVNNNLTAILRLLSRVHYFKRV